MLRSCDVRSVRWSELVRVILKKMFRESEKNRKMRTVRAMLREPLTGWRCTCGVYCCRVKEKTSDVSTVSEAAKNNIDCA
jgi:hypothetical protein